MKAGDLRHRITIQRQASTETQNTHGEQTTPWVELATVWAAIEPQSGGEATEQDRRIATVTHRVRIRHREGVTPAMRVLHGARVFEILAVVGSNKPVDLVLQCREVV
ncbi:MAG: phage head closure protein [Chloroflexi bacterium]|nr:phage head closure protein [Chloroflexota bacterium]